MNTTELRRIVDSASKKHALKRGGHAYLNGFIGAFASVYPQNRWGKVLQKKFFLPDESRFSDKAFYRSASELSVANHICRQHIHDFAVDKKLNRKNKKDVDVSCEVRSTQLAVEVKCPDESEPPKNIVQLGSGPVLSLGTAGRIPDHVQQLSDLKKKIESAGTATVVFNKNRDLALKDALVSANDKFSPSSSVDALNVLFLAAGYAGKIGDWYMNLFAPQGLFTPDPLHAPSEFSLVDVIILSNLKYWHQHAAAGHDWTLRNVLLLPFPNPHRRVACVSDASRDGLSLFPHLLERFNTFIDPAIGTVPMYVLDPLKMIHFIGQALSEAELDRYFPVKLYPLGKKALENAAQLARSV